MMKADFYKIECITNLHVGSGDVNYNIIDNQVEKDAVNGLPIIHASGIKGALRDVIKKENPELVNTIFGDSGDAAEGKPGSHKFLDAIMIARPMRVAKSNNMASIRVATVESINNFILLLDALNANTYGIKAIGPVDFGENKFLTNAKEDILVEGDKTGKLPENVLEELNKIKDIIGETIAIAASFDDYDLPVVARNYLQNGISKNLWYEEVVPHGSIFCFAVIAPDNTLKIPEIVQFGGNATIGCGISKVTKL